MGQIICIFLYKGGDEICSWEHKSNMDADILRHLLKKKIVELKGAE